MRCPGAVALFLLLWAPGALAQGGFRCGGYSLPPGPAPAAAKLGLSSFLQSQGRVEVLLVFAAFADEVPARQQAPEYAAQIFDPDLPGSFSHFYATMSLGQLQVRGTALTRRYAADHPASAYLSAQADEPGQYGQFTLEILQKVDAEIDLSRFDNDGPDGLANSGDDDGAVDYVFVDVRSAPRNFLLGPATGIAGLGFQTYISQDLGASGEAITVNGGMARGAIQQEGNFAQTVGSMAHEFGHSLGLPDLYDLGYEGPEDDSAGIGQWGLMGWGAHGWNGGDGPNPFCAWSLEQLGWIGRENDRLVEVRPDTAGLVLADLPAGGPIAKIPLRVAAQENFGSWTEDYLLLEMCTRQRTYYHRNIPAEGLLVWHVQPFARSNEEERHKLVDLVCADGLYQDAGYPLGRTADPLYGLDNLDFWAHDPAYAAAHGGNSGDAADPFDGLRALRLDLGTNPSANPRGVIPAASTGLAIQMRRQGQAMRVAVVQPRWAGTIREEVHWAGRVIVDGDLRVAPEGALFLHQDAQVQFAGTDRLGQGRDPGQCELEIQGDFTIFQDSDARKVVFEALNPGENWYGLLVAPAASSSILVPEDGYELRDAAHGIVFPGSPPDTPGRLQGRYRLADGAGGETAGNGDGRLSPGESFQWEIQLANWSLALYRHARLTLRWNTDRVRPTWSGVQARGNRIVLPDTFSLGPGRSQNIRVPSLTLDPQAQAGELAFILELRHGAQLWQDTFAVAVVDTCRTGAVALSVPGGEVRGQAALIPADQATAIQAAITSGEVAGVDLVARSFPEQQAVLEIPMTRRAGEAPVFAAAFQPPFAGQYQLFARLRSADGGAVFSRESLVVWAVSFSEPAPVMAFIGSQYPPQEKDALRQVMAEELGALGLEAHFVDAAPEEGAFYDLLLPRLPAPGLVIWLGRTLQPEAQAAFRRFLERGGRVFFLSASLDQSPSIRPFLEEMCRTLRLRSGYSLVRTLYLDEPIEFNLKGYTALNLLNPAEPVLLDSEDEAAGLRLEKGGYRLVYLPFDWYSPGEEMSRPLFASGLLFLHQQAVRQVRLEVLGRQDLEQALALPLDQPARVRAAVEGAATGADLIVRSVPQLELLAEIPLEKVGQEGGGPVFAGRFQPPGLTQYHLSLRLRTPEGQTLFSSTHLRVVGFSAENPVLLLLGKRYTPEEKETLKAAFAQALGAWGLTIASIDLGDPDGPFYDALLSQYLGEGRLVIWLGETLDERSQAAFRRFLERGGRLFIASLFLRSSPQIGSFSRDLLHLSSTWSFSEENSQVRSRGLLPGPELEFRVPHGSLFSIRPPAVPILTDELDRIAGLRLDSGVYRLVYLPFELKGMDPALVRQLVEKTLPFLRRGVSAVLEVPNRPVEDYTVLVQPDRSVPIRAQVEDPVQGADLVVRTYPTGELAAQVPMALQTNGGRQEFTASFQPPAPGQYQLLLRLRHPDGRFSLGEASLQLIALLFDSWPPALIFLDESYSAGERTTLRTQLAGALRELGLEANILDLAPAEGAFYPQFLAHYLDEGELVIWLGHELDPGAQVAFRRFVAQGGHLLMALPPVGPRQLEELSPFLKEVFHVDHAGLPAWGSFSGFVLRLLPLELAAPAEPALLTEKGEIAGLRVDAGAYRAVYLSFDLSSLRNPTRGELLAAALEFLHQRSSQTARLSIETIAVPPTIGLAEFIPRLVVANTGNQPSAGFRAGYQILQGDQVLATLEEEESGIASQGQQEIHLPPWRPAQEGTFAIRFGLRSAGQEGVEYLPARRLHVVQAPLQFEEVELPGQVSRGNGAAFFDSDSDGDLDLLLVRLGAANQLFRNDGSGFAAPASAAGAASAEQGRGLAVGDPDGDGDLDLYLVNEGRNRFLCNEGDGQFAERTDEVLADPGSGRSAGFFDADLDGDLDLFLVNAQGTDRFFQNEGGVFAERAAAVGLGVEGNGRGLAIGDWDHDGDPDLFVADQSGRSRLFRNEGGSFADLSQSLGLGFPGGEVGAVFGDGDGDGDQDLFVSNERDLNHLYRNDGAASFQRLTYRDSLYLGEGSVGCGLFDYDNDGDLDLATASFSPAFGGEEVYQNRPPYWVPMAGLLGLDSQGNGRGLSFGDFDQDGDQDLFVADYEGSRLYRNQTGQGHWLELDLEGPGPNRHALGARVEAVVQGQRQYREVQSAYGYASQVQPRLHLGLRAGRVDTLRVKWPDGRQTLQVGVLADRRLRVFHPDQVTAVAEEGNRPGKFALLPAYPNPFNPLSAIQFQLPREGRVRLEVYDLVGQRVRLLVDETLGPGLHQRLWDGLDDQGRPVASGVYLCRLRAAGQMASQRLVLLK